MLKLEKRLKVQKIESDMGLFGQVVITSRELVPHIGKVCFFEVVLLQESGNEEVK